MKRVFLLFILLYSGNLFSVGKKEDGPWEVVHHSKKGRTGVAPSGQFWIKTSHGILRVWRDPLQ
ncbi:MAG TPA: hypothetical protein QGF02_01240 [Candidatus Babeliales bacterium]|nr:hypothetical protein [Candidatus Babeliales bacterium]